MSNTPYTIFSVTYYLELVNPLSFAENVKLYQIKSLIFYNVQTAYLIFASKK